MTTATKAREITIERGEKVAVGRAQVMVTACVVSGEGFTWDVYVTSQDAWWEGCGNCDSDSGTKPWFGHVYGGVCFQCGGNGVHRIAGSEKSMKTLIRRRISGRLNRLNVIQKREDAQRAAAEAWSVAHPNLASDLARERAFGDFGHNVLGDMALALTRGPLSVKQAAYTTSLLRERAEKEAHAIQYPVATNVWIGNVEEKVSVTGVVNVAYFRPTDRFDRTDTMLIVLEVNVDGERAMVKMQTSAAWAFNVVKGQTISVSGTIKDHADGAYGPQTLLKRPTLAR